MHNAQQRKFCFRVRLSTTTTRSLPHLVAGHGFVEKGDTIVYNKIV
jgi:hypothetical protein